MNKKILLIGSGPSSLSACIRLLEEENVQIYLVDGKDIDNLETEGCIYSKKNKNTQSRYKKLFKDNLDSSLQSEYEDAPRPSLQFGGYSTVWGGALNNIEEEYIHYWKDVEQDLDSFIPNFKNIINFCSNSEKFTINNPQNLPIIEREERLIQRLKKIKNNNLSVDFSTIALSSKVNSNICEECGEYTWSCRSNSSWSSTSLFKELIDSNKIIYIKNTSVFKIEENKINNTCSIFTSKDQSHEIKFDKVFVGAGAIGSSKIVLNSFEDITKVEIKTNDLISIPLINLSRKGKKRHTFTDLYIKYNTTKTNLFAQYYGYSDNLLNLSEGAVPIVRYIKKLFKPFLQYAGGIFLYLDQDSSSTFSLEKEDEILVIKKGSNPKKIELYKSIKSFILILLKARIICLPLGIWRKYGKSNHYGAQFSMANNVEETNNINSDNLGRIKKMNDVHFIDSSVLPVLSPGPITLIVMLNAYRIVNEAINETEI